MKLKEIIFLIFLVAAGILFTHIQTGKLDWKIHFGEDIFFHHDIFTYHAVEKLEAPFPPLIEIINPDGPVQVESAQPGLTRIKMEKRIRRASESEAADIADQLKITVSRNSEKLIISTNRSEFDRKPFETHFAISLPAESRVVIKETSGDVRISGVKEADISSRYGDVSAAQIKENLTIKNRHHDVEVEQVGGWCVIESTGAGIKVRDVQGRTSVQTQYGRVDLEALKNGADVSGPQTRITAQNIQGLLDISSTYKPIHLQNTGPVKINAKQSEVTASGIEGSLEIKNQYARVRLDHIRSPLLDIRGKSIEINADDVKADEIYLSSSYRDITLSDFEGKTTVVHSNGSVSLHPNESADHIRVHGDISDIFFYWPLEKNIWLSAQTERGKIKWSLPEEPAVRMENNYTLMKSFSGKDPEHMITLFTKYGTIRIEPAGEKTKGN
ncbi:MAG: DUF4097 family beta strand repeat-containing protein [Candidatus Aminicenantes bacterium]